MAGLGDAWTEDAGIVGGWSGFENAGIQRRRKIGELNAGCALRGLALEAWRCRAGALRIGSSYPFPRPTSRGSDVPIQEKEKKGQR